MIELFHNDNVTENRKSCKGNQLKWRGDNLWYKADYAGYEGLAEYMVSHLLQYSTIEKDCFILYDTEEILYESKKHCGCRSVNFLPEGWQLITLERLFQSVYGHSLHDNVYAITDLADRMRFLVDHIAQITGLADFGRYMSILLTIDALFLNEDRHMHNIAVLLDREQKYHYCPIFDNGASLLSDTFLDYPMDTAVKKLLMKPRPKTFCSDFEEQLKQIELLYGKHIRFTFTRREVESLLEQEPYYSTKIKQRVAYIIMEQSNTYRYLFTY